jgi:hypothetical protein
MDSVGNNYGLSCQDFFLCEAIKAEKSSNTTCQVEGKIETKEV